MAPMLRHRNAIAAVVALLVVATACSSDGEDATSGPTTTVARSTAAFCTAWRETAGGPSEEEADELLRLVPAALADAAQVLRSTEGTESTPETDAAVRQITEWVAINCVTDTARRVAPPADASLPGLRVCTAGSFPVPDDTGTTPMLATYYGEADRADPYDGPLLAVFSTEIGNGGFAGDGEPTPVTVRGRDGVAAPITVFQQTIVPQLGTVVTWTEGKRDVAIFGRLWPKSRTQELVALADQLEVVDGRFTLPSDALPAGYEPVYSGEYREEWSPVVGGLLDDYHVQYRERDGEGIITLSGAETTAEEYDAPRVFEFPLAHERIGEHDALVGSAWSENKGPWMARWRDPDGFTLRIVGLGVDREDVLALARQSRDLDHSEWTRVVSSIRECPLPVP